MTDEIDKDELKRAEEELKQQLAGENTADRNCPECGSPKVVATLSVQITAGGVIIALVAVTFLPPWPVLLFVCGTSALARKWSSNWRCKACGARFNRPPKPLFT
ncbi:MAG: hypothetical protein HN742_33120 [Lentisphaerae bacterium]|nr:hypothetical protein [Lentisphaerota bacterium]MBT7846759.1 hypothetical protein [Lentisphaerota bacterium]